MLISNVTALPLAAAIPPLDDRQRPNLLVPSPHHSLSRSTVFIHYKGNAATSLLAHDTDFPVSGH